MHVDWQPIIEEYNKRFNTHHQTLKQMLAESYQRTRSSHKMAEIFGFSPPFLRQRMREQGIPIQGKGNHRTGKGIKKSWFLAIPEEKMKHMTTKEIARKVGCSQVHALYLVRTTGRKHLLREQGDHREHVEQIKKIPASEMKRMTARQIAEQIGCEPAYVYHLLRRTKRKYRQVYK